MGVLLCCATPEFVWGLFLFFPGLHKTGASLHGIMGHGSGPFRRCWVAAVVHCSCIACCGSDCAMFLQCSTEALSVQQHRQRALPEPGAVLGGSSRWGKGVWQLLSAVPRLPLFSLQVARLSLLFPTS